MIDSFFSIMEFQNVSTLLRQQINNAKTLLSIHLNYRVNISINGDDRAFFTHLTELRLSGGWMTKVCLHIDSTDNPI